MNIQDLRTEIDFLDRQLIKILFERFQVVTAIAKYKAENNLPVNDDNRVKSIMKKHAELAKEYNLPEEFINELFTLIISACTKHQEDRIVKA